MKAQARTWFNISGPFQTWESLKDAFNEEFVENDECIKRERFQSLKQRPDETVNMFRARLERESEDLNMTDKDRKWALENGLRMPLSIHVKEMSQVCHSYKSACATARIRESQIKVNTQTNNTSKNLAMGKAQEFDEYILSIGETTERVSNSNSSSEPSPTLQRINQIKKESNTATSKEYRKASANQICNRNKASSFQSRSRQNLRQNRSQQKRTQTLQGKETRKQSRTNVHGCFKCHGPHIAKNCPLAVCTYCAENHHFSYCTQRKSK